MNKFVSALLAGAMLVPMATPALADPGHHGPPKMQGRHDNGRHVGAWKKGQRFDSRYATHYSVIDYRRYHGLRAPPRGYHWVRSGNDAVLVAIGTGLIASVIANTF